MEAFYSKQASAKAKPAAYNDFYMHQAGGAFDPYVSYRYLPTQRGNGFFGRLISGGIMPLIRQVLPYLTSRSVEGVEGIVNDMKEGRSIKESAKRQLKRSASTVLQDMATKISKQAGSGLRRRKHKTKAKRTSKAVCIRRRRSTKRQTKKRCVLFA